MVYDHFNVLLMSFCPGFVEDFAFIFIEYSGLYVSFSAEKSTDSLIGVNLYVVSFFLQLLKKLSLSLILGNFIIMCLGEVLFSGWKFVHFM